MTDRPGELEPGPLAVRAFDANGRVQMAESRSPFRSPITPTGEFFVVHHYDFPSAELSGQDWTFDCLDAAGNGRTFSIRDLKAFTARPLTALVECAGMSRGFLTETAPGTQFGNGMVGCADWVGVSVPDVLDAAGVKGEFEHLLVLGADSGVAQPENEFAQFAKAVPFAKAMDRDTILAWDMGGGAIPALHGGPLRLLVPGWYGVWWVKWVRQIRASNEAFNGFWQSERYTFQDSKGKQTGVVAQLRPRSLITSPAVGTQTQKGRIRIDGLAWSGESQIAKVEVTPDRGRTWIEAELARPASKWSWREWSAEVEIVGASGLRHIGSRATDFDGCAQDWASEANRLGYANNFIQEVTIDVIAG